MVHVWSIYGPLLSQGSYAVSILFVQYKTGAPDKKCTAQMIVHHKSSRQVLSLGRARRKLLSSGDISPASYCLHSAHCTLHTMSGSIP